jgi:uncharacterized protein DUF4388
MAAKSDAKSGPHSLTSVRAADGFDGQLRCATLADLVQLQCLSQARSAICVRSDGRVAHLFFNQGQIVHAVLGDVTGELAAYQILGWTTGSFAYSNLAWPERNTVSSSWQRLLLNAAHQQDEQNRLPNASGSRLIAVAAPGRPAAEQRDATRISSMPPDFDLDELSHAAVPNQTLISTKPPGLGGSTLPSAPRAARAERAWAAVLALESLRSAARLDSSGTPLSSHGTPENLLGLATYVRRLAEAMGSDIGQSEFRVFEYQSPSGSVLLFADTPVSTIVVETEDAADLRALRRTLQL